MAGEIILADPAHEPARVIAVVDHAQDPLKSAYECGAIVGLQ